MNFTKETGTYPSSNGTSPITYYVYKPANPPKAILQISHGMCEYIERYEDFANFMAGHDILVCGNDHLGHRRSVSSKEDLGYFAPKDGWTYLPKDLSLLTRRMKEQYPGVPYFLFGHSMGSFIARTYLVQFGDLIDGAIICGTAGANPVLGAGKALIGAIKAIKGERFRSPFINKIMFGSYNNKYENPRTSEDWLTRDTAIVDEYREDEYCTFIFTTSAFKDLTLLLEYVNSESWFSNVSKVMPLYLISGDMDPVGNWGVGIREIEDKLKAQGLKDFTCKLYPEYRHEILNEVGKEDVYEDILQWIMERL